MNLAKRIEHLEQAMEQQAAPDQALGVTIILAETREQALQLQSLPPVAPPTGPGRIVLSASVTTAAEYLAQHPATAPSPRPETEGAPPAITETPTNERGHVVPPRQNSE